MTFPLSNFRSAGAERLAGMARLVRRICVLREQGEAAAAEELERNEYASLIRDIRLAEGPDALPENELRAMFATEERRVADAVVLAEFLVPQLVSAFAQKSHAAVQTKPVEVEAGTYEAPVRFSRVAEPAAGSTAIPDLLDAMLAADGARRQRGNRLAT